MKKYIVFIPILLALFLGACTDEVFLSQKSYSDHYKVGDDVRSSVIGLYAGLQKVQERLVVLNEVRSDLLNTTNNAPLEIKAIEMLEYDADNDWLSPTPFYNVIVNCNDILANIHDVKERDVAFTDDAYHTYYAEVLTIRAWCYYQLFTLFDKVPYHESPVLSDDLALAEVDILDTLNTQLDSVAMIYSLVEDDFYEFPNHFNRMTALALQGEINLELENYEKAYVSFIQICVDEDNYRMGKDYENENWIKLFSSDESDAAKEVITWIDFNILYNQQHHLQNYFSAEQGGSYWFRPSYSILSDWVNQIDSKGNKGDKYRGGRVSYKSSDGKVMVNKYSIDREFFAGDMNLILYRASTAALLLAEAANRNGSAGIAVKMLNDGIASNGVRGRVGLDVQGAGISDMDELEDIIVDELALELAFEGRRFNDLVRIAERRGDRTWIADKIAAKFSDPDVQTQMKEKIMNAESLKIPFRW